MMDYHWNSNHVRHIFLFSTNLFLCYGKRLIKWKITHLTQLMLGIHLCKYIRIEHAGDILQTSRRKNISSLDLTQLSQMAREVRVGKINDTLTIDICYMPNSVESR